MKIKSTEKSKLRLFFEKILKLGFKPLLFILLVGLAVFFWFNVSGILAATTTMGLAIWVFGDESEGDAISIPIVVLLFTVIAFVTIGVLNEYEVEPNAELEVKIVESEIILENEKIFITLDPALRKDLPNSRLEDDIIVINWLSDKAFYAVRKNAEKEFTAKLVRKLTYDHQDKVFNGSKPSDYELELYFAFGGKPLTSTEYEYECKDVMCSEFFGKEEK